MTRRLVLAALAAAMAAASAGARPALAYVRYRTTDAQKPFFWADPCVGVIAYSDGLADMMSADQVLAAASGAAAAWSAPENGTSLMLQVTGTTGAGPGAKYDGQNSLLFEEGGWCKPASDSGGCVYDQTALAVTTVFAKSDGRIVDGDIDVNATSFTWVDATTIAPSSHGMVLQDLQNALAHEMGHLIGLDHPCVLPNSMVSSSVDNLGNPVPTCDAAPPEVIESTMFPSAVPGDITKRTLAPDDVLAVHEIYPPSAPRVCPTPEPSALVDRSGGCALSGGGARAQAGLLAALAAACAFCVRRRRRGARTSVSPRDGS